MMRIITGSARGTHLYTPTGDTTRPTSERAKEALFSMLGQREQGARVLDLFAGSGQLGLEALSRGAACAVFVDGDRSAVEIVQRNAQRTHLADRARVLHMDALAYLRSCSDQPFDLVFLDPPYRVGVLPACLRLLWERGLLRAGATVVAESGNVQDVFGADAELAQYYEVCKQNRYGAAYITLLVPIQSK